jgi:arylsulfatase A-like enzyme
MSNAPSLSKSLLLHRLLATFGLGSFGLVLLLTQPVPAQAQPPKQRPNIVWIIVEDMSPHFACYGESGIATPNVDRLASEGVRFSRAFVTAPICSTSRSSLITGRYQTSIGAQNHRSSVPGHEIRLSSQTPLVTELFHASGYHVNNVTWVDFLKDEPALAQEDEVKIAKTDYNFEWEPARSYDRQHWAHREKGKPFFVQIQLEGGKLRGQAPKPGWPARVLRELGSITEVDSVQLPECLPDDPIVREDWAQYLDCVRYTDHQVGAILQRLQRSGDLEQTVLFFMTDHGISHVRHKQFLYDGGLHVPLIVRGPGITAGEVRNDLVEHIDLSATSLTLAGIPIPAGMHSQNVFAQDHRPRTSVFAARDRADETVDWIRSVRSDRFKYIRNGFPDRPYLQPNAYKDSKAIVQAMRRLHAEGRLSAVQSLIMADSRPVEELYDLENDPNELHNLADRPEHRETLRSMRRELIDWQQRFGDTSGPENEQVYDQEVGGAHVEGGKIDQSPEYQANVALMKRWRSEKPFRPVLDIP